MNTHDFDVFEAGHDEILENFTTNAACADHQQLGTGDQVAQIFAKDAGNFCGHSFLLFLRL